ncbi:hypothetical protein H0H92_002565 [Tricholoma furcatifolium]|nr:hypothetical protein H0H92_002565 [Tricholoma furcatifolium]
MSKAKFKVAICGAGVGGLAFAVALSRYPDIEIEIFEAASEFSPIGAGIGIWPRAWKALVAIGLEDLAVYASRKPSDERGAPSSTLLFFHRADFHAALLKHLSPSCHIQYGKRLRTYNRLQTGGVELVFEDNSESAKCDLLVGADGIKSAVRRTFLREQAQVAITERRSADADSLLDAIDPVWTGAVAYRTLIPVSRLRNYKVHEYGVQFAIAYPVANGELVNLVFNHFNHTLYGTTFDGAWIQDANRDEFIHTLSQWEPEFVELLQGIREVTKWAIHVVKPLQSFASDGIALLGDAAHAMAAHQGSGAGQAIEDGCVLAELLGHHLATQERLSTVLRIYDAVRRPFALDVAQKSWEFAHYLGLTHEDFILDEANVDQQERQLREMSEMIIKKWEWAWTTCLDDSLRDALSMLEVSMLV